MALEIKLRKVGNSIGLILPKEALGRLKVKDGDAVYLTESPEGGFRLTAGNPAFADQMAAAEDVIRRYRNALNELAK
jgi:putative addiction module antidote